MASVDNGDDRILLVDPTGALERRLGDELAVAGFEVTSVGSAEDCLRLVEQGDVDGIVSEYVLPDLDGIRLLRSIRISHPTLPFVLFPDEGSEKTAGEAIAAGVSGYVPGDGDPATVVSRLEDGLRRGKPWTDEESQQRYRHLVEVSPAPINLFDETGESIWCNDATLDLLDLDGREELIGNSIFEFIHPDDHELAREELEHVIAEKESVGPTQMKLRRPDGEVRYVQVSTAIGSFLGDDIGQAVVVDVTPLREAQKDLREERQFVENALDTLQDVFYVVDAEGELVRWNETGTEVTGYEDEELESMNVTDLFAEADRHRVRESISRVLEEGSDRIEARLVTKHGRYLPYEFRGRRLRPDDERGNGRVVGIGRDVSERKERERQLKVLERWLRHNIRNEMNVITGTAEMIDNGELDDVPGGVRRIHERAEHLVEQADRERELVDLLTDPPEPEPIEVADVIGQLVTECRSRYPSAEIDVSGADDLDARAVPEIKDAIGELIENAIEHNDTERPTVRIEVGSGDRGQVTIRIVDNGPGIPEEEREVLLLEREIDQQHHGSGLGLLFVYWVIRVSGGDITFEENDPRGSIVTLTLPPVPTELSIDPE